jgi:hypothetical protein
MPETGVVVLTTQRSQVQILLPRKMDREDVPLPERILLAGTTVGGSA